MKMIIAGFLVCSGFMSSIALAEARLGDIQKKDIFINVSEVFVATGQTADRDAVVIVSGMFPNSCYAMSRVEVKHISEKEHLVKLVASVTEGMCLMVIVPYTKEINLGRLSRGEHIVRFVNGDSTYFERTLTIN